MKGEPEWMRTFRHKSLDYFLRRPMPQWGGDLDQIDFDNIFYFLRATEEAGHLLGQAAHDIKNTYDRPGIPEAEKQRLIAGVAARCRRGRLPQGPRGPGGAERPVPGHRHRPQGARGAVPRALGDGDPGGRQQVRRAQLGRVVGRVVHLDPRGRPRRDPLQAYFRINSQNMGQFERTLIIAEPSSSVRTTSRAAPRPSTPRTRSTRRWSRSSSSPTPRSATPPSRTGVPSTTWSQSGPRPARARPWVIDGNIGSKLTVVPGRAAAGRARPRRDLSRSPSPATTSTRTPGPSSPSCSTPPARSSPSRSPATAAAPLPRPGQGRGGARRELKVSVAAMPCCWTRSRAPTPTPTPT